MCRCGCVFFVLLLLDFWLNGRNWAVETTKRTMTPHKKRTRTRQMSYWSHTQVGLFRFRQCVCNHAHPWNPVFRNPSFMHTQGTFCPLSFWVKVDAVIQFPTRLHSLLEVTSRSNLQSSTGQVQHRETHEVCHRGTRSFLLDRPAAITLLGRREKEEERERERERENTK